MKKIIQGLALALLLVTGGCEHYLDVNRNEDAPDRVEGSLYLAGILAEYEDMYWDTHATAPLTQMMGTTGYTAYATHYCNPTADSAAEIWYQTYFAQGMNLENMINQSIEAEEWTLAGIGMAIKAFSWDALTKQYGDLPCLEAFVPGLLSHHYDYQDVVFGKVREWAYRAIEYLEMEDRHVYGNKISESDFIYAGRPEKWIRFAYGVIVRNLASLTNKRDFAEKYAAELLECASKSFQSADDDAAVGCLGGGPDVPFGSYNNLWGTSRGGLSLTYFQHEWAVEVMTGTVPAYDQTGRRVPGPDPNDKYHPFQLASTQIICDTLLDHSGHYDPRVALKLGTTSDADYADIDIEDSVKAYKYYGGSFTSRSGSIGTAPSYFGRQAVNSYTIDGPGRWLYRDEAPYVLMTYAELCFCVAETYWKLDRKGEAYEAWKRGVEADMATAARYIVPGQKGKGGDKITADLFRSLAEEYLAGPYVAGLGTEGFTLSHLMMQKWVALYPWGALEAWVDMRKYHYDIQYTGDYPEKGNGWIATELYQKRDEDPAKVYKGFYLLPAKVDGRSGQYTLKNDGSPCYRIRPRYNSEYMWNRPSLEALRPISGTAENYQCSIPWFAYPNGIPGVEAAQ